LGYDQDGVCVECRFDHPHYLPDVFCENVVGSILIRGN